MDKRIVVLVDEAAASRISQLEADLSMLKLGFHEQVDAKDKRIAELEFVLREIHNIVSASIPVNSNYTTSLITVVTNVFYMCRKALGERPGRSDDLHRHRQ